MEETKIFNLIQIQIEMPKVKVPTREIIDSMKVFQNLTMLIKSFKRKEDNKMKGAISKEEEGRRRKDFKETDLI